MVIWIPCATQCIRKRFQDQGYYILARCRFRVICGFDSAKAGNHLIQIFRVSLIAPVVAPHEVVSGGVEFA